MIKKYKGYEAKRISTREQLPIGGYVVKIMDANVIDYSWGSTLKIDFDISEGDYKGFFAKDYRANTNDDKKWRGNFRINIPDEKNQYFDSQVKSFNNFVACFEESNSGFHWDSLEEKELKGKTVGMLFRNKEWEKDGNSGWFTEACAVATAQDIRDGNFKVPKDKPLKIKTVTGFGTAAASTFADIDDADLPF